jgi:F0F1-type ATP synthase membrane subunit b/b'
MATSAQTIKRLSNTNPSKLNKKSQELELENIRGKGLVKNFANKNSITNILPNNNSKSNNNNNIINTHVIDFDIDSNDYINNIGNNEVINSNNNLNNNDNDLFNFITNNKNKTPTLKKSVSRRMMNNINIFEQDDIEENNLRTIHNKINENTEDIKDNLEDLGDNLEGVEDNLEDLGDNLEGVEDNLEEAKDNVVKAVDSIKVNITEVFKDIIKQEDIYTDEKVQKSVNDFSQFLEINIDNIESAKKTIDNKINNNTETDTLEEYNCNEESLSTGENNDIDGNNDVNENNDVDENNVDENN